MAILPANSQLYPVDKYGLGGLNTYDDPSDINDIELADVRNMIYDNGLLYPRNGSLLYLAKPTGETSAPFQLLTATDVNGVEYMISNYGTNFYLADTINKQWIKLNQSYTPTTTGLFYGSVNWSRGLTDSRFYFCNGSEDCMKWIIATSSLKVAAASSDTTITLNNSTPFPGTPFVTKTATTISFSASSEILDSGNGFITAGFKVGMLIKISGSASNNGVFTIVAVTAGTITTKELTIVNEVAGATDTIAQVSTILVQNGSTAFTLVYTANNNNTGVLTLNGTVGQVVPIGSTVTTPIVDVPAIPRGKVLFTDSVRLYTANGVTSSSGASTNSYTNAINGSTANDPESWVNDGTATTSFGPYFPHWGKGGILEMNLFGQYPVFLQQNVIAQLNLTIDSTTDTLAVSSLPVISGDDIGPVSSPTILNYMNKLYYPTANQGIVSFSPDTTGSQTTSSLNTFSQTINNLITDVLNFTNSRTCGLAQKLYWLVSLPIVGVPSTTNNLVIMYDLVRASQNPNQSAWAVYDNWNAVDIKPVNDNLYYLSINDGAVYQCNVPNIYQDAILSIPTAYTTYALSKRFNLNTPELLMRGVYLYVEGYVSLNTTFYINVLFNEKGTLGQQPYTISGTNTTITSNVFTGGLGRFMLGSNLLGGLDLQTINNLQKPLFFRCYLELSQAFREHNLQIQAFATAIGSQWGISKICIVSVPEPSIETSLVLSPSSAPMLNLQSL